MQKNYELLYIVHPDLESSTEKVTEKVAGFITKAGGEVTYQEDRGKRKLAYKIANNEFGVYILVNFAIDSLNLRKVERDLRLSEEILRSMIVAIPELKEVVLKPRKEKTAAEEAAVNEPDSIIVTEEKPASIIVAEDDGKKKKTRSKKTEEVAENTEVAEEKAAATRSTAKKSTAKKAAKTAEVDEEERLKKLDEKLDELLK